MPVDANPANPPTRPDPRTWSRVWLARGRQSRSRPSRSPRAWPQVDPGGYQHHGAARERSSRSWAARVGQDRAARHAHRPAHAHVGVRSWPTTIRPRCTDRAPALVGLAGLGSDASTCSACTGPWSSSATRFSRVCTLNIALWLQEHTSLGEHEIDQRVRLPPSRLDVRRSTRTTRRALGRHGQTVAIARAIACTCSAIFYDEPTTGLDPVISSHHPRTHLEPAPPPARGTCRFH